MDAVTYPDTRVQRLIEDHFIPVQFNVVDQPEVMERFNTPWTPTLMVQDADGKEHRRSHGYLDAPRFLAEMSLGWLLSPINRRDFETAHTRAPEALEHARGDLGREPEAIYWAAVAAYKATEDAANL